VTTIRTVGVVGAGTMGLGIAHVCAMHGFTTLLYDVAPAQAEKAIASVRQYLSGQVQKGKFPGEECDRVMSRLRPVQSLEDLRADLIIEAAVEKLEIKKKLFGDLERINSGKAILATNTSSLSVSRIGEDLANPSRCIGLHFFNPAERMKLVEIISGSSTSPEVVGALREFSTSIQKIAVAAKDSPGFIVNRVARPYYAEALRSLENKTGTMTGIDRLMRASGFRMGPFELMDLIGVDTNLAVTTSVYEGLGCPSRFKPSPIQQQLVREGSFGRKSGKGFYHYAEEK
jgi:3-hydroxybutyryl-CoA dehydrogenase